MAMCEIGCESVPCPFEEYGVGRFELVRSSKRDRIGGVLQKAADVCCARIIQRQSHVTQEIGTNESANNIMTLHLV